jgi:hypothetical protein
LVAADIFRITVATLAILFILGATTRQEARASSLRVAAALAD